MTNDEAAYVHPGDTVYSNGPLQLHDTKTNKYVYYIAGSQFTVVAQIHSTNTGDKSFAVKGHEGHFVECRYFEKLATEPLEWTVDGLDVAAAATRDKPCAHVKGSTPLMGWVICKVCGINLEKWGLA